MFTDFGFRTVTAGSIGRLVRAGDARGTLPSIGGTWTYSAGEFVVTHPKPRTGFEVLMGLNLDPGLVSYPVPLLAPAATPGKPRRWFGCPSCGRKCSKLYLKAPRSWLACRRCLGLKYSTQYASRSAREFARRLRHASRIPPRPVGIWQPLTDWPSVRRHLDP